MKGKMAKFKKSPTLKPSKRALKSARPASQKKQVRKGAEAVRKKVKRSPMGKKGGR